MKKHVPRSMEHKARYYLPVQIIVPICVLIAVILIAIQISQPVVIQEPSVPV